MIHQRRFRPPGSHPDTGTQIDCGIYFFLMVQCYLNGISLSTLTPNSVHHFRLYLAHCILHQLFPLNIESFIQPAVSLPDQGPTSEDASVLLLDSLQGFTVDEQPLITATSEANTLYTEQSRNDKCETPSASRHHLHRRAKQSYRADQLVSLPPGRVLLSININDEAFDHSYAALSTLSDIANHIGAGAGLFAKRDFSYNCPLDD